MRDELEENLETQLTQANQLRSKDTEISRLARLVNDLEKQLNKKEQDLEEINAINEDKNQTIIQLVNNFREEKKKRQQVQIEENN
ncbi:MAG: hypothetical protein NY202_00700 [Mollicutes bacterium UO1]